MMLSMMLFKVALSRAITGGIEVTYPVCLMEPKKLAESKSLGYC